MLEARLIDDSITRHVRTFLTAIREFVSRIAVAMSDRPLAGLTLACQDPELVYLRQKLPPPRLACQAEICRANVPVQNIRNLIGSRGRTIGSILWCTAVTFD